MLRSYHYGDFLPEITRELLRARANGHFAYCLGYPDAADKCPRMTTQKWAHSTPDIRETAWLIGYSDAHLAMPDLAIDRSVFVNKCLSTPPIYTPEDSSNRVARWYGYWHATRGLDPSPFHDPSFARIYRRICADHRPELLRWWMQGYDDAARQEQQLSLDKKPKLYPRTSANTGNRST